MQTGSVIGRPRVAIVHDYLTQRGGAERVVLAMCRAFPDAPVYTSLYDPATTFDEFRDIDVRPLWLDRLSPLRSRHRLALPLLPLAFSTSRVDADVVVCSSSGWAHGIRTEGRKIVYCHSPAKWLHRREDYLGANPSKATRVGLGALSPALRQFDRHAAVSADQYVANSSFIADQIRAVYGIDPDVLVPPPGLTPAGPSERISGLDPGFVLAVARLLPYKNVRQVVEAFQSLPDLRLAIVGEGSERERLMQLAGTNVTLLGEVSDAALRWLYGACGALVSASREDLGLTPLEAATFGKPTAALRWGGFLDTVVPGLNGLLIENPEPRQIAGSVRELLTMDWDADRIREHAAQFAETRFVERLREVTLRG